VHTRFNIAGRLRPLKIKKSAIGVTPSSTESIAPVLTSVIATILEYNIRVLIVILESF
jgi:hypothetical protein